MSILQVIHQFNEMAKMLTTHQTRSQEGTLGRRKTTRETGSFGKSTRRSRSKTNTPARREDPTITAADKVFTNWFANQNQNLASADATTTSQRKPTLIPTSASQPSLGAAQDEATAPTQTRFTNKREPTEVILRGYRSSSQQYAAIHHYEQLAGRICEDYPRDPPAESRRYKSELRDPGFAYRRLLTPEERAKVYKAAGGEHWVKVTFESAEAADAAISASPQTILGHLVYAEPYRGMAMHPDEPIPDRAFYGVEGQDNQQPGVGGGNAAPLRRRHAHHNRTQSGPNVRFAEPASSRIPDPFEISPPQSQTSSRTADTATASAGSGSGTLSSGTISGFETAMAATTGRSASGTLLGASQEQLLQQQPQQKNADDDYCRAIPSVRKARLLPMEQALLPAQSFSQRLLNHIPFLKWFSGSMIGNEVPRTETGEFDWNKASVYWKFIWYLDAMFGLFQGEIMNADKDD